MTKVIDRDEAIALLERAVNEKGADYVYPDKINCLYADGNRPGCIVGHALSYVGVSVDQLARLDHAETYLFPVEDGDEDEVYAPSGNGIDDITDPETPVLKEVTGIKLTEDAVKVWKHAQVTQDSLKSWGEALDNAKKV